VEWSFKMTDDQETQNTVVPNQSDVESDAGGVESAGNDSSNVKVTPETDPGAEKVNRDKATVNGGFAPKKFKRNDRGSKNPRETEENPDFVEKVIAINRITKVTKGGKKMSFSALVVVGDMKGRVGYSLCKASEVATAIRKAMGTAKKNMILVPMRGSTIPHEIIGECSGSRVLLKPASDGTGVIAAGPVRAICDGVGIHNILSKCHRSNNPINVVKATIEGLSRLKPVEQESV
jgi:small subunit ribosomal protein S5